MKTYWLKIAGLVALTLVVIIAANFFGSADTKPVAETKPIAKSGNTRHFQQEDRLDSQAQLPEPPRRWLDTAERKRLNPPPRLYQLPSFRNEGGKFTAGSLKRHPVINGKTSRLYPNSTQPNNETIELLRELRARHNRQHVATGKEMPLRYLDSLKTKGAVEQVKPELPEGAGLKLSEEQMRKIRERALLHIIEQYRNNLEDKKIRELLLERLKPHQKQRKVAAKEKKEAPSK